MLRGLAAGALLLVPVDLLLRLARRGRRRRAAIAAVTLAAVALGALLLVPAVRKPYDALIAGPGDGPPAAQRPRLLLMTSLPIVWGEYGAFDRRSRPSQTLRALREEFEIVPIDVLDRPSLADGRLLLLAQPRWLSPVELTALDAWIRGGGRALILADPDLVWPSDLPLGDVRRPLTASLLGPLLAHWRLELLPPPRSGAVPWLADDGRRRIVMDSPGRFAGGGAECRVRPPAFHARCAIGAGRAILLADADLVRDDLWVAPRAGGDARALRLADNPLHIADLLDEVAGLRRERVRLPVAWVDPRAPVGRALLLALLPLILLWGGAGLPIGWRNFGHTLFHRLTKGEQDRNRS